MLKKLKYTALLTLCAVIPTACNYTVTSEQVPMDSTTISTAAVTTETSLSSATPSSAETLPDVTETTDNPDEINITIDTIETAETVAAAESPSISVQTKAPTETAEPPATTTVTAATATSQTEPPAETTVIQPKPVTESEEPVPVESTASNTTATEPTEAPPQTDEEPDPEQITLSDSALQQLSDYGIDAEKREKYYTRINSRADIPIIHISTRDEAEVLSITDYTECLVDVFGCEKQFTLETEGAGIRVRGNSTAYYGDENQIRRNQVPYRIKFNEKTNILGLNDGAECKSWVLLKSNWNLIMDYTAFNLADVIFDGEYYYSDCAFVHLYINEDFKGVYVLAEQNQVNPARVDINEPAENYKGTDIGYFVEIDNYADPEQKPCFSVDYLGAEVTDIQGETRQFDPADYSIDSDIYSEQQTEFISKYINNVFKIVYEATQKDNYLTLDENFDLTDANDTFTNPQDAINAVMDIDSVVNMYTLYEICHDYDCGEGSFYMAVDFSPASQMKRLTFTAPWDFNWAYNDAAARYYYAGAFNMMNFVNQYGDRTNPWFVLLMTEEWFRDMVSEKWAECYGSGRISDTLLEIRTYLEENADDLNRWDQWGTDNGYKLLDWVTMRCKWLDREFSPASE